MAIEEVHWHEGLFLLPQHFQMMQRQLSGRFCDERHMALSYPYGLIECRYSHDELANGDIQVERLRAVMPGGTYVDVPGNADLPTLHIKDEFEKSGGALAIHLAVPRYEVSRQNTFRPSESADAAYINCHYRVGEISRPDENSGREPKDVEVRRLNVRLVIGDVHPEDLELLPVMRIERAAGDAIGNPQADRGFVPPCLVLAGSQFLQSDVMAGTANLLEAARAKLATQMVQSGFNADSMRAVQFAQVLRLRTFSSFAPRLMHLAKAPAVTPFAAYLELRALLGELLALEPGRRQPEIPDYNHDHPGIAFMELYNSIRPLLQVGTRVEHAKVPFEAEEGILVARLSQKHLAEDSRMYLGIKSELDPNRVAAMVLDADRFKLMAANSVKVGSAIFGIRLERRDRMPVDFPGEADTVFFELQPDFDDRSRRMWRRIQNEKAMAIWLDKDPAEFAAALFIPASHSSGERS